MASVLRPYGRPGDFDLVRRFLAREFLPGNRDGNWLQTRWEYMHFHPNLNASALDRIGMWEDNGQLAAVAHYEDDLGTAYCETGAAYKHLQPAMVEYAEQHLSTELPSGDRYLRVFAYEHDAGLAAVLAARGFQVEGNSEVTSEYPIDGPVAVPHLPDGFRLISLADENDLRKVNRVLWRAFNHPGEPPEDGVAGRVMMQSAPSFRPDLNMVVVAPDGRYVSYAGMLYELVRHYVNVEPVATDPDFRRMGLGRAAVMEGIRRCATEGANIAFVGSGQQFYLAMGFRVAFRNLHWVKRW